eukprot:m.1056767 g.1056767  ORF g.1056767 m.1056767 type:complete len:1440 (-) comp24199_c1_seq2:72-4391(-)
MSAQEKDGVQALSNAFPPQSENLMLPKTSPASINKESSLEKVGETQDENSLAASDDEDVDLYALFQHTSPPGNLARGNNSTPQRLYDEHVEERQSTTPTLLSASCVPEGIKEAHVAGGRHQNEGDSTSQPKPQLSSSNPFEVSYKIPKVSTNPFDVDASMFESMLAAKSKMQKARLSNTQRKPLQRSASIQPSIPDDEAQSPMPSDQEKATDQVPPDDSVCTEGSEVGHALPRSTSVPAVPPPQSRRRQPLHKSHSLGVWEPTSTPDSDVSRRARRADTAGSPSTMRRTRRASVMMPFANFNADALVSRDTLANRCLRCGSRLKAAISKRVFCQGCNVPVCGDCSSKRLPNHPNIRVCTMCYESNKDAAVIRQRPRPVPFMVASGYLTKSNRSKRTWQRRFFTLDSNGLLLYFKYDGNQNHGGGPTGQKRPDVNEAGAAGAGMSDPPPKGRSERSHSHGNSDGMLTPPDGDGQGGDTARILLTGWFVKRGDEGMLSRRRKRFFVLRATHIEYYAHEGTQGCGHDVKGRIDLACDTTVELKGDKSGHLVGLALVTQDRVFSLSAISPDASGATQTASVDEREQMTQDWAAGITQCVHALASTPAITISDALSPPAASAATTAITTAAGDLYGLDPPPRRRTHTRGRSLGSSLEFSAIETNPFFMPPAATCPSSPTELQNRSTGSDAGGADLGSQVRRFLSSEDANIKGTRSRRSSTSSTGADDTLPEDASTDDTEFPPGGPSPARQPSEPLLDPGTPDGDLAEVEDPGDTEEAPTVGELVGAVNVGETCTAVVGDSEVDPRGWPTHCLAGTRLDIVTRNRRYHVYADDVAQASEWRALLCLVATCCHACGQKVFEKETLVCCALAEPGLLFHSKCCRCVECPEDAAASPTEHTETISVFQGHLYCSKHYDAQVDKWHKELSASAEILGPNLKDVSRHLLSRTEIDVFVAENVRQRARQMTGITHDDDSTTDDMAVSSADASQSAAQTSDVTDTDVSMESLSLNELKQIPKAVQKRIMDRVKKGTISVGDAYREIKAYTKLRDSGLGETLDTVELIVRGIRCIITGEGGVDESVDASASDEARIRIGMDDEIAPSAANHHYHHQHKHYFDFTAYKPEQFADIRGHCGISPEGFLRSFEELPAGKHVLSGGASGCFVVTSVDRRYVVKSMRGNEKDVLLQLLPQYDAYLAANPNTLLTRILGVYQLKVNGTRPLFAIVMTNVLSCATAVDFSEVYDLKGSFVGRSSATAGRASFSAASTSGTRKDLDLRRPISLSAADCTRLTTQLTCDTEFLEQWGLMDYSLILAIHNCPPDASDGTQSGTQGHKGCAFAKDGTQGGTASGGVVTSSDPGDGWWNCAYVGGGIHGQGTKSVYLFGIIDFLQRWDVSKAAENRVKSMLGRDKHGISAVHPSKYAQRFRTVLCGRFVPTEGLHSVADVPPESS